MQDVVARIKTIMENEGLSPASFADAMGIGRPLMSHVLGGRNNPSLQLVMKILESFPSYSAAWLLQGQEERAIQQPITETPTILFGTTEIPLPAQPEKEKSPLAPSAVKTVSNSEVVRTMLFYADGTFEEYKPRK